MQRYMRAVAAVEGTDAVFGGFLAGDGAFYELK
jgi:hypothetical protein